MIALGSSSSDTDLSVAESSFWVVLSLSDVLFNDFDVASCSSQDKMKLEVTGVGGIVSEETIGLYLAGCRTDLRRLPW